MAAGDHVPGELIEDILSRVAAKSLVRFKTVSKKWYSLLSQDDKFAKFHLKRSKSKNHQPVFLQISPGGSVFVSFDMDNTDDASRNKFNSPVEVEGEAVLVGSANGLVCLAHSRKGACFIWNPSTGECKTIRVPIGRASYKVFGFGYDSCSDDYKILANWDRYFRVFSLKTNSWKPIELFFPAKRLGFHLNGFIHWCLSEKIAAFDLAKDVFSYIELPDEMKVTKRYYAVRSWEYQGLFCLSELGGSSIWVMKIYGDPKSWVKLSTSVYPCKKALGISTLGEVVYQMSSANDPAKGGIRFLKSDIHGTIMSPDDRLHIYHYSQPAFVYTDSLISPSCFDALHENPTTRRPRKQRKTTGT